jgi:tetratricopeptide (TPR) repeat protein
LKTPLLALLLGLPILLFVVFNPSPAKSSTLEVWKTNQEAAAKASKLAHFAEAEKLLLANQKLAETFPPKDARLPRTIFDLAQVYRAEGKYSDALPLYERALQIYTGLYGAESTELADTLDGEAELFTSLNDYPHAEPLLLKSLALRQELLPPDSLDTAQSKNDLGEVYTQTGEFGKAEPLLLEALAIRKKAGDETADVAQSLEALGTLYSRTGRPKQAELAFRGAVSIYGKTLGGEHLTTPMPSKIWP